jgi:hypothetical protein
MRHKNYNFEQSNGAFQHRVYVGPVQVKDAYALFSDIGEVLAGTEYVYVRNNQNRDKFQQSAKRVLPWLSHRDIQTESRGTLQTI